MTHHGAALHMLTKDETLVQQLKDDYKQADLDELNLAMLDYAVKLTVKPSSVKDSDVQKLRDKGFTDRAILDICQITAYFNFVNRLAEGLGVELEPEYK
jgi:uncharacterized peroxidase-related enzyme